MRQLGAEDVVRLASRLSVDDETFVIGGQAVNLWAWIYRDRHPYLAENGPFTSQDIDYFGTLAAAERFAIATGGVLRRPDGATMNSPQTAIVQVELDGLSISIDFLNGILGVARPDLRRGISVVALPGEVQGRAIEVHVPVLHPVICLQSRIGNMLSPATLRRDPIAWRQLHAAVAVISVYLDDALDLGDFREVKRSLGDLFAYMRSHTFGKVVDRELGIDILDLIKPFVSDPRIDARYRAFQIEAMIETIEARRSKRRQ